MGILVLNTEFVQLVHTFEIFYNKNLGEKILTLSNSAISFLGIYPTEIKVLVYKNISIRMLIEELSLVTRTRSETNPPEEFT